MTQTDAQISRILAAEMARDFADMPAAFIARVSKIDHVYYLSEIGEESYLVRNNKYVELSSVQTTPFAEPREIFELIVQTGANGAQWVNYTVNDAAMKNQYIDLSNLRNMVYIYRQFGTILIWNIDGTPRKFLICDGKKWNVLWDFTALSSNSEGTIFANHNTQFIIDDFFRDEKNAIIFPHRFYIFAFGEWLLIHTHNFRLSTDNLPPILTLPPMDSPRE
jgi:hypothetical protein